MPTLQIAVHVQPVGCWSIHPQCYSNICECCSLRWIQRRWRRSCRWVSWQALLWCWWVSWIIFKLISARRLCDAGEFLIFSIGSLSIGPKLTRALFIVRCTAEILLDTFCALVSFGSSSNWLSFLSIVVRLISTRKNDRPMCFCYPEGCAAPG